MQPLIETTPLSKKFHGHSGFTAARQAQYAVKDVSFSICKGETLGLVGESGCGKSTLGRMAAGLLTPTQGDVLLFGKPLYDATAHANHRRFRKEMCRHIQMVFQDPFSSLNPRMTIGHSVAEPLICSPNPIGKQEMEQRVLDLLEKVGISKDQASRYPHEFSGGQRQRVAIARALVTSPDFVVCDEPTSSLDTSVQGQILNLLLDMQEEFSLAYLFISHDLDVVRLVSDQTMVMYAGCIVEQGPSHAVFASPLHPYTQLLLASAPGKHPHVPDLAAEAANSLEATGCPFAPRCPKRTPDCPAAMPPLVPLPGQEQRLVRCVLY